MEEIMLDKIGIQLPLPPVANLVDNEKDHHLRNVSDTSRDDEHKNGIYPQDEGRMIGKAEKCKYPVYNFHYKTCDQIGTFAGTGHSDRRQFISQVRCDIA